MRDFPIIGKLGGRDAVFRRLQSRGGQPKTVDTLRMWRARGRIPGEFVQALMTFAEEDGVTYQASDFALPAEAEGEAA